MSIRTLTEEDLRWLVCPACHQSLHLEASTVVCSGCTRRYPVVDGIPILLPDKAL
ncbi:MAG TPA: Trm112 family protein [Edaphobacter sp.]|nr:Trm112 family protein [Edaphobacter sp.]